MLILTPDENYFGYDELKITVKDVYDSSISVTIPVHILPINDPPVLIEFPDSISLQTNDMHHFLLTDFITDIDNELAELSISLTESELIQTEISGDSLNIISNESVGIDSLKITISDGKDSVKTMLLVSVIEEVAIDDELQSPDDFQLSQNYPNPFNPSTNIEYSLPKDCHVNLTIYNIIGQKIITLVDENKNIGNYSVMWNGENDFGVITPAGIYIYKLETDEKTLMNKMLFVK